MFHILILFSYDNIRKIPFEVAVGMNGAVWIRSASVMHTIIIRNAILNSETMSSEHVEAMVEHIMANYK